MTIEEFKAMFESDERPKIRCSSVQEQADTYEFLERIGYILNEWESGFLRGDENMRSYYRRSYQHPKISALHPGHVCTSCQRDRPDDIRFEEIADLIYEDHGIEVSDLEKLLGGI